MIATVSNTIVVVVTIVIIIAIIITTTLGMNITIAILSITYRTPDNLLVTSPRIAVNMFACILILLEVLCICVYTHVHAHTNVYTSNA